MNIILYLIVTTISLLVAANFIPGFVINNLSAAIVASIVLGLLNFAVKPFLILITLPINILTLGIFTFIINALILWFTSDLVGGFKIANFGSAVWGGIVVSLTSMILYSILS